MTSTQLVQLEDEELLERVRVAPSATCEELAIRFEERTGELEAYQAVGSVLDIVAALELARTGSFFASLHPATPVYVEGKDATGAKLEAALDAALGKLKF